MTQIDALHYELPQVASEPCHPDDCKRWLMANYELLNAALTAAAEVGRYEGSAQQLADEFNLGWEKAIERCARELEKEIGDRHEIAARATRIRALKDKP